MRLIADNGNEVVLNIVGTELKREYWCDGEQNGADTVPFDSGDDAAVYLRSYVSDLKSDGYRDVGGRPTTGKPVHVRLPVAVIAAIDALVGREGTSRPLVMARLLTTREHV